MTGYWRLKLQISRLLVKRCVEYGSRNVLPLGYGKQNSRYY
jgi:hypothetical protein